MNNRLTLTQFQINAGVFIGLQVTAHHWLTEEQRHDGEAGDAGDGEEADLGPAPAQVLAAQPAHQVGRRLDHRQQEEVEELVAGHVGHVHLQRIVDDDVADAAGCAILWDGLWQRFKDGYNNKFAEHFRRAEVVGTLENIA